MYLVPGSSVHNNLRKFKRTATAIDYAVLLTDDLIAVTSTAAIRTMTLPTVATAGAGKTYTFKDESGAAGTNNIIIDGNGAELVDGNPSVSITEDYGAITVYCSGTAWHVV